jgi:hypothetical protein
MHLIPTKLRIVCVLRLCPSILSPVIGNIRRSKLLIGLHVDLVIADNLLNSEVVIIVAMMMLVVYNLYHFDIVDYLIVDLEVI